LVDKESGDVFNGTQTREMLGLPPQIVKTGGTGSGGAVGKLNKSHFQSKYYVFIQSTSFNRELLAGTKFMYEVEDWDRVA